MLRSLISKTRNRTIALLIGTGFVAGLLGGLLGIGGGAFVVPVLVFFLAFDQHKAHGTSLAVVLALSIAAVATYSMHRCVNLLLAVEIAFGGVVGAMIGGSIVQRIRSRSLRRMFSLFIVVTGAKMAWDGYAMVHASAVGGHFAPNACLAGGMLAVGTGVLTGFVSAILGVGGGIVMVPALTMLLHFPQQEAQGVSLAAMMPIAFTGMLKHNKLGNVDFRVAEWLGFGAVIGAALGATIAGVLQPGHLKLLFGGFLIIMAALMAARRKSGDSGG